MRFCYSNNIFMFSNLTKIVEPMREWQHFSPIKCQKIEFNLWNTIKDYTQGIYI